MNKHLTENFGGVHGKLNPASLEHMLEEVQGSLFGRELYPTIISKAAFIWQRVSVGHFFVDGNKRTGFMACLVFLDRNSYDVNFQNQQVISMAVEIVTAKLEVSEIEAWLMERCFLRRRLYHGGV